MASVNVSVEVLSDGEVIPMPAVISRIEDLDDQEMEDTGKFELTIDDIVIRGDRMEFIRVLRFLEAEQSSFDGGF